MFRCLVRLVVFQNLGRVDRDLMNLESQPQHRRRASNGPREPTPCHSPEQGSSQRKKKRAPQRQQGRWTLHCKGHSRRRATARRSGGGGVQTTGTEPRGQGSQAGRWFLLPVACPLFPNFLSRRWCWWIFIIRLNYSFPLKVLGQVSCC